MDSENPTYNSPLISLGELSGNFFSYADNLSAYAKTSGTTLDQNLSLLRNLPRESSEFYSAGLNLLSIMMRRSFDITVEAKVSDNSQLEYYYATKDLMLAGYKNLGNQAQLLEVIDNYEITLQTKVRPHDLEHIYYVSPVTQTPDHTSIYASWFGYTSEVLQKLEADTTGAKTCFINCANGSTLVAADIFDYMQGKWDEDSVWYPVRFSQHKHGDRSLVLPSIVMGELEDTINSFDLVILFDEDVHTGNTIADFTSQLVNRHNFSGNVYPIANTIAQNSIIDFEAMQSKAIAGLPKRRSGFNF